MKAIISAENQLILMSETLQEDVCLQEFLTKEMLPIQIMPFQMTMEQMQPSPKETPEKMIRKAAQEIGHGPEKGSIQEGFDEFAAEIEKIPTKPRRSKK